MGTNLVVKKPMDFLKTKMGYKQSNLILQNPLDTCVFQITNGSHFVNQNYIIYGVIVSCFNRQKAANVSPLWNSIWLNRLVIIVSSFVKRHEFGFFKIRKLVFPIYWFFKKSKLVWYKEQTKKPNSGFFGHYFFSVQ